MGVVQEIGTRKGPGVRRHACSSREGKEVWCGWVPTGRAPKQPTMARGMDRGWRVLGLRAWGSRTGQSRMLSLHAVHLGN